MANEIIKVPDLGGADSVEVIEVCVQAGDVVAVDDSLVVLESDKASMDVPSTLSGKVLNLLIKEGDSLSEGDPILEIETEAAGSSSAEKLDESESETDTVSTQITADVETEADETESNPAPQASVETAVLDMLLPDTGSDDAVEIIEVSVAVGDQVAEGDSILVLETDKATVEMPAPASGTVKTLAVSEGDKVKQGNLIGTIETAGRTGAATQVSTEQPKTSAETKPAVSVPADKTPARIESPKPASESVAPATSGGEVYAGPAVRQMARKLGVDLARVTGTGPRNRILKEDVEEFVKQGLTRLDQGGVPGGTGIPKVPEVDFSKFGEIEVIPLTKIQKVTAANMTRAWLNVPHVTQFDEADITEMEDFRKALKTEGEKQGIKITPLAFLLKACASALAANPDFNRSISADGESFIQKHYINIGIAVDTPRGLMVPVLKDADKKGLWQLADEANMLAARAREGKLSPNEMQGGCFTISSLGGIGGTGFTPIVSPPELAILGVSKSQIKPVWDQESETFEPRLMLPLSVSYDHRAINGAGCGRFFTYLVDLLSDVRRLSL